MSDIQTENRKKQHFLCICSENVDKNAVNISTDFQSFQLPL